MADHAETIARFFERLPRIEPLVRIITCDAPVSAAIHVRGEQPRYLLFDLRDSPIYTRRDAKPTSGMVTIAIDAERMHEVLEGQIPAGLAFGRRELLLKGSPLDFVPMIRLIEFAPILYREHLLKDDLMSQTPPPLLHRMIQRLAWMAGWLIGTLRYRVIQSLNLLSVMEAMADGLRAAQPALPPQEPKSATSTKADAA